MADVLTTRMNDTAGVAQHINNMRAQQQRLQQLNQPSRIAAPASGAAGRFIGEQQ
jgi:hypothetical protein